MSRMSQILSLRYWQSKSSNSFVYIVFSTDELFITLCNQISNSFMGFASKCSILKLPDSGVNIPRLKIFDMWLIPLDRVTQIICTYYVVWPVYTGLFNVMMQQQFVIWLLSIHLSILTGIWCRKPINYGWNEWEYYYYFL